MWSFEIRDANKRKIDDIDKLGLLREYEEKSKCPKCYSKKEPLGETLTMSEKENTNIAIEVKNPRFYLDKDVFLPSGTKIQIDEAITKIKYHKRIYQDWNFASVDPCGKGLILNFYGKSGTGKTLTAEALAGTLGSTFISLGMSDVESKFMGETAKNIRKAFALATEHGSILFFDEADTLLGKRLSNVTQGIDNEVNSMRSTILIELERFEGVVIFATNFEKNYDKAFQNRISQHVHFMVPDFEGRKHLWNKHLVNKIPLEESREDLIEKATEYSEGLVGRDIRTCMRLALPKIILEEESSGNPAQLKWLHIEQAIQQVKKSIQDVGSEVNKSSDLAYNLLGVSTKKEK